MNEIWAIMRDIEESMEKFHRRLISDFNLLPSGFQPKNFTNQINRNLKTSTIRFYARREIDSSGKDLQEAYMEVDGDKKYWKKDGDKETLIEPNKSLLDRR